MQSNIEEHGLSATKRTFMERVAIFMYKRRNNIFIRLFGILGVALYTITDSRKFMIVMHTISFCVVAACIFAAFKTGKYTYYFSSAAIIVGLSCLWPEFTTRTLDKWRKAMDEERNRK